jgi:hypothetical protein
MAGARSIAVSRRPLLRDLLERSPREHRGRAATRCFSHITLALPQEEVDDDYHLSRGAHRDLAQSLTSLHQKDFADLLGGEQVRYDVIGTDTLGGGEVEVRFGHAVYLPAPDEKVLYNVSLSRDSAVWHPVCPIYPAQRLVLLGAAGSDASIPAPTGRSAPTPLCSSLMAQIRRPWCRCVPRKAIAAATTRAAAITSSASSRRHPFAAQDQPQRQCARP